VKNYLSLSLLFIASLFFATTMNAQDKKQVKADNWPQKTAFHTVMSETFHPAESGNLDPIKKRSEELVKAAEAWMNSNPPADIEKPELRTKIRLLYRGSVELNNLIKNGGKDEEIKASLSKLHDLFHEIVGLCSKEGDKKDEHKKH
jgi:hypothetical protein